MAEEVALLGPIEHLTDQHDVSAFDAGPNDAGGQAAWLKRWGLSNDQGGFTRTFVACFPGTMHVGAFYGIATASVVTATLPKKTKPYGAPSIIPAALLAQLGVHRELQGQRFGGDLVADAISRLVDLSNEIAFRMIVVDAASDKAQRLYARFQFKPLGVTDAPTRLFLPTSTATALVRSARAPH
jgi:ribosomal protein S18 acetylase RimI-like enzyme